uniref:Uncharacterized protein n=1 Tax=Arundo donax TaxID=35708 RepID=A0A0A9FPL6_ARUDO
MQHKIDRFGRFFHWRFRRILRFIGGVR